MTKSPAIDVVKNNGNLNYDEPITLTTGIIVKLRPVPSAAITKAQSKVKDPSVPKQKVEGKDYLVENPTHPDYLAAKREAFAKRVETGFDVMAALGIELVNGLPEDERWLKELKLLNRLGHLDLDDYDLKDEIELEFVFKRYIAMAAEDWQLLGLISGVTEEAVAEAKEMFPGT